MLDALYTLLVYPITQIIELVYIGFDNSFNIHGVSIIGVSLVVTLLTLPLYIAAERLQATERNRQLLMQKGLLRIKQTFTGDERYLLTTTFYKEHRYSPFMQLSALAPLAIQLPFFIAAYNFLSSPSLLDGSHFLFVKDLSKEDALFLLGGFSVNVLPIFMTLINIASSIIYCGNSKEYTLKDKLSLHIMALVFLVILYKSPSGLVIYWTMNNIFSLVKTIYLKLPNPAHALYITLLALLGAIDICCVVAGIAPEKSGYIITVSILLPIAAMGFRSLRKLLQTRNATMSSVGHYRSALFLLSTGVYTLLVGFVVPSQVIASSPQEFSFIDNYTTPLYFLFNALLQSAGAFFLWPNLAYSMASKKARSLLSIASLIVVISGLLNVFAFPGDCGSLSATLVFDGKVRHSIGFTLLNNAIMIGVIFCVFMILYYRKVIHIVKIMVFATVALFLFGIFNTIKIQGEYLRLAKVYTPPADENNMLAQDADTRQHIEPIFTFYKDRPNVIIIMLDRAISGFTKTVFSESPALQQKYDGFVFYPNTVSFGFYTLEGAPALFGGYEYTPRAINRRKDETLVSKHNEALAVLPRLFSQKGYLSTITDAPWANYSWISDMSYMHEFPEEIRTLHTMRIYKDEWEMEHGGKKRNVQSTLDRRNFLWYSVMMSLPCNMRRAIYNDGDYWASSSLQSRNSQFLNSYSVLDFLPRLTKTEDAQGKNGSFIFLTNDATHDAVKCQAPDYVPVDVVTDDGDTIFSGNEQYHGLASSLHVLGKFFDYLRNAGVYDNTRIIIVSDHGRAVRTGAFLKERKLPFAREFCNPLLLVKDFGATAPFKENMTFMTNADVPVLATQKIIKDARNPFSQRLLDAVGQKDRVIITSTHNWVPAQHGKYILSISQNDWWSVRTSIFSEDNWSRAK